MAAEHAERREAKARDQRARAAKLFVDAQVDFALANGERRRNRSNENDAASSCPVPTGATAATTSTSPEGCKACAAGSSANLMPKIENVGEDASRLSSERQVSSIPIGPSDLPNHQVSVCSPFLSCFPRGVQFCADGAWLCFFSRLQEKGNTKWTYPSPKMFYNAMRRKGWQPKEEDMDVVVAIHNTVNERVWHHILQ